MGAVLEEEATEVVMEVVMEEAEVRVVAVRVEVVVRVEVTVRVVVAMEEARAAVATEGVLGMGVAALQTSIPRHQ